MTAVPSRAELTGIVALLLWVVVVLAAAVANLLIAVAATNPFAPFVGRVDLVGADAAAAGWPAPTPLEWPAPMAISSSWSIAHREATAFSGTEGATTHQMQYYEFGWPWPVLERVQLWWPWDDPAWATPEPPDSGLRFVPLGVIATPLIAGSLIWLVIVGPFLALRAMRRRRRIARGRCVDCGYPIRGTDTCPECGTPAPVKPRAA